mmetsp:Transcript_13093/g.38500  ORF Transcript_13093/g.38500 Transcript_13093/m.38500 type:complete len:278 (+) Transcript_13093:800-1633(+)
MDAGVALQHAEEGPVRETLYSRQRRELQCVHLVLGGGPAARTLVVRPGLARAPLMTPSDGGAGLLRAALLLGREDDVCGASLLLLHLLKIPDPVHHEEGGAEVLVALARIAESPAEHLVVDNLGNVVDEDHDILIKGAEEVGEVIDAGECEQRVDALARDCGVEHDRLPLLRASKIRRDDAGARHAPALSQEVCNFGDGVDELLGLVVAQLVFLRKGIRIVAILAFRVFQAFLFFAGTRSRSKRVRSISKDDFQHSSKGVEDEPSRIPPQDGQPGQD